MQVDLHQDRHWCCPRMEKQMFKKSILAAGAFVAFTALQVTLGGSSAVAGPVCGAPGLPACLHLMPGMLHPIVPLHPVLPPIGPLPTPPAPGPSFGINVNLGGGSYGGSDDYVSCHDAKS